MAIISSRQQARKYGKIQAAQAYLTILKYDKYSNN